MLKDLGIGPKTNFVVYIIRVCRIRDGASCVAAQRYSALRNFYNNLKVKRSQRSSFLQHTTSRHEIAVIYDDYDAESSKATKLKTDVRATCLRAET